VAALKAGRDATTVCSVLMSLQFLRCSNQSIFTELLQGQWLTPCNHMCRFLRVWSRCGRTGPQWWGSRTNKPSWRSHVHWWLMFL